MNGAYDGLMRSAEGMRSVNPVQPQATLVHHEKVPAFAHLDNAINEIDGHLEGLPLGAPEYDELVQMRHQLATKKANVLASHDALIARKRGMDARNKFGKIATDPTIESLERGLTPGTPR